jgi:hypothetical protein
MTCWRIARNTQIRELLPLIGQLLKEYGIAGPVHQLKIPGVDSMAVENLILILLANFFYQLHTHPSVIIPGFPIRCLPKGQQRFAQWLHNIYVPKLFHFRWLIYDRTTQ